MTGSGVMTIIVYKRLTRSPEIAKTTYVWVLPNNWRKLGIPNLARMFLIRSVECCKIPGLQFYRFQVIKQKLTGRGGKITPPRLGL